MLRRLFEKLHTFEKRYIGGRYTAEAYLDERQTAVALVASIVGHPLLFMVALAIFGYLAYQGNGRFALWIGLIATFAALVINLLVKGVFRRDRPLGSAYMTPLPFDEYSFPSAHASTSFAFATSLSIVDSTLLPYLLVWAIIVSASRVLAEAHHIVDILAGMLTGMIVGAGVTLMALRF